MGDRSLTKNFIYNILYQVLVTALPVLTTPYIARVLGLRANGIHSYTEGIVTYFMLFGAIGTALYGTRKVAYERRNPEQMTKTVYEIMLLRVILILITLLIYIPIFCITNEFAVIYRIQIINIIASGIDISWFFQGVEDFKKVTLRNLFVKAVYVICLFVFIKQPSDLPLYVALIVLSALIGNITMWYFLREHVVRYKRRRELRPFSHIKGSISLFIPQITNYVYALMDRSMLKWITHSTDFVGIYDQAQRLIRAVTAVLQSVGYVMMARLSYLKASEDESGIRNYIHKSINFNLFWAFPIMFGVLSTAHEFIPVFLGDEYMAVIPVLQLLSPLIITMPLNSVLGVQLLIAMGKEKAYTVATSLGALSNVIINILLMSRFNVVGACISSLFAEGLVLIICLIKSKEYIDVRKIMYDNRWVVAGSIIMYGIVLFLQSLLQINVVMKLVVEVAVAGITYFIILYSSRNEIMRLMMSKVFSQVTRIRRKGK